ncbi:MAG TPA: EscU/YscU/HrcU family type III secretion system export apparatus switch protein [Acidobacteriota bacterium]|nr:EscU/YscU/HrcU family type III secretion system export apparatus switch protein [Acidobacteriota bacterium]
MNDKKTRTEQGSRREREFAAALRYSPYDDPAPRMTAKGHGKLAQKIIRMARESGVPVRQDRDLVQVLSRLDLNEEIPAPIYAAVAEILAFLYRASLQDDPLDGS